MAKRDDVSGENGNRIWAGILRKILAYLVVILPMIFAIGVAWSSLNGRVTQSEKDIIKQEATNSMLSDGNNENRENLSKMQTDIRVIQTDLRYIAIGIEQIKKDINK